ncbi:Methyltransferase [uncultured virus]|nr:Methyltransferase [uncultured virus]
MDEYARRMIKKISDVYDLSPIERSTVERDIPKLFHVDAFLLSKEEKLQTMRKIVQDLKRRPTTEDRADERVSITGQMLGSFVPKSILDVGAGTGEILTGLQNHYRVSNAYAIDFKLPTKDQSFQTLLYTDQMTIPLPNESVDLIIIFETLHHIHPKDRLVTLKEVARILKPGGRCLISEHDDNQSTAFYNFMELYHLFWYAANNEKVDPLYLMARVDTMKLFKDVGLTSMNYQPRSGPNPQRIYHEVYTK